MIRQYNFDYNYHEAYASFTVDTKKFKESDAKMLLEFFDWDINEDGNLIDELMTKYALKAIEVATAENCNIRGVKRWFQEQEGFLAVDGSKGVELTSVTHYEFSDDNLEMEVIMKQN